MRADLIGQALGQSRLDVGVVEGARNGDEHLRRPHLAGAGVDLVDRLAGIIDEHALAGRMSLPQASATAGPSQERYNSHQRLWP
jgi:hypothetical protein